LQEQYKLKNFKSASGIFALDPIIRCPKEKPPEHVYTLKGSEAKNFSSRWGTSLAKLSKKVFTHEAGTLKDPDEDGHNFSSSTGTSLKRI
jgi:hypothetical protein